MIHGERVRDFIRSAANKFGLEIRSLTGPHRDTGAATFFTWLQQQGMTIATVHDVGASDGRWSRRSLSLFPNAMHVLYEPNPVHHRALHALALQVEGLVVVPNAVGAVAGRAVFDAHDPFGGALADPHGPEAAVPIDVEVTTLDETAHRLGLSGPHLVKLDTHGFERGILDGASRVLQDARVLVIEAYNHRLSSEGLYFWELCQILHEQGFRPVDLFDVMHRELDGSLWQMDLAFFREDWPGFRSHRFQ